jgi:maltooligosyltrehalose trehalohydrolase
MEKIRVWAPYAKKVDLKIQDIRIPMDGEPDGWWVLEAPIARHGDDYSFILDDREQLPDPPSPWQPKGVSKPSRFLDHSLYPWSDSGWQQGPLSTAIIYELHVGTFSPEGTFEGVEKRLEYLADLGITHIELMPVNTFPGFRGWGYDGVCLYAPLEAYGGPYGLKKLVDSCHAWGLGVILDVVYNHLGPSGNYLDRFGPYFTGSYSTPWGRAMNLDGRSSHEVRRFLCDNALMWLRDYHMDGLRLDAVHAIIDTSALNFLEQLARETDDLEAGLGRHLYLIAENDRNDPRTVQPYEIGGYGMDAQWNDDFHHALHAVLTGERNGYYADFGPLSFLATALQHGFVYDGRYSVYRGRPHGRPEAGLSGHTFVAFLQNHDQIGNRALGERIHHLAGEDQAKIGAALVFTSPFIPLIFQGEEWGASNPFLYFSDHQDPELAKAVTEGRRNEFSGFGWDPSVIPDPQSPETFRKSCLSWEEKETGVHAEMLDWYRRLIRLRKAFPELCDGHADRVRIAFSEKDRWLVMQRGTIGVLCNFSKKAQNIRLKKDLQRKVILASREGVFPDVDGISLPGESAIIVQSGDDLF